MNWRKLLVIAISTGSAAVLSGAEGIGQIRKHFEWGEYDSLIVKVPGLISADTSLARQQEADLYKYLGVAHFIKGDTLQADANYHKAFQMNAEIFLDSFYLDSSAILHFHKAKAQWAAESADSSKPPHQADTLHSPNNSTGGEERGESRTVIRSAAHYANTEPKNKTQRKPLAKVLSPAFYLPAGCFLLGGIFSWLSADQYLEAEENFKAYKEAAEQGWLEEYNRLGDEVKKNDRGTLLYGGSALLAYATGLYLIIRKPGQRSRSQGGRPSAGLIEVLPSVRFGLAAKVKYRF